MRERSIHLFLIGGLRALGVKGKGILKEIPAAFLCFLPSLTTKERYLIRWSALPAGRRSLRRSSKLLHCHTNHLGYDPSPDFTEQKGCPFLLHLFWTKTTTSATAANQQPSFTTDYRVATCQGAITTSAGSMLVTYLQI